MTKLKSIKEINQEIKYTKNEIKDLEAFKEITSNKRKIAKLKEKLTFFKTMIAYLETEPRLEYLQKESAKISEKLAKIESEYRLPFNHEKMPKAHLTKLKNEYNKMYDVKKLKMQLSAVSYLIQ